jgi:hypothetical protein
VNEWVELLQPSYLLIIALFIIILLGIVLIAMWVKLNKLRKTYVKMMDSMNVTNLEQVLIQLRETIESTAEKSEAQQNRLNAVETAMKKMQSRVGITRYNAFGDLSSNLSFSIALMNELQDGVVLTGIHNRDETHMYAKPIAGGQSEYRLSPEEKEAISQCVQPEPK